MYDTVADLTVVRVRTYGKNDSVISMFQNGAEALERQNTIVLLALRG